MSRIRRYLMAGLLVWLPLGVTIFVVMFLVNTMDQTLLLLPAGLRPDNLLGFHIPGLGVLLTVGVILLTGIVMAHFFGKEILAVWESILNRIPLVRSIYTSVKQLSETLLSTGGQSFRKVLLIEYPRRGSWPLAFQPGTEVGEAQLKTGEEVINVYVPTTPNPTSGFFLMIPRKDVVELDMSVDQGLKMIISMGVVVPKWQGTPAAAAAAVAENPPEKYHGPPFRRRTRGLKIKWENPTMRSHYCGHVNASLVDQDVEVCGWVPRRRDHPDRRARAQRVRTACAGQGAAASCGHRKRQSAHRSDRDHRAASRDIEPLRAAAVPDRRRKRTQRRNPPALSLSRSAPSADAAPFADARPDHAHLAPLPRRPRLPRHRDADAHQVHARRRA